MGEVLEFSTRSGPEVHFSPKKWQQRIRGVERNDVFQHARQVMDNLNSIMNLFWIIEDSEIIAEITVLPMITFGS